MVVKSSCCDMVLIAKIALKKYMNQLINQETMSTDVNNFYYWQDKLQSAQHKRHLREQYINNSHIGSVIVADLLYV